MISARAAAVLPFFFALLMRTAPARAEWSAAAFLGASATRPATLTLRRPERPDATLPHVRFVGRSFESPPYYGYRVGWRRSARSRVGVESELIHLKVYARSETLEPPLERFSLSHGLNLLLGSLVWRTPIGGRISFDVRAGAGVAIPHAESRVSGIAREQYEISSLALQAAAGPRIALWRHGYAFAEYKLTSAAPAVHVAGGTVSGRYTSQHAAAGLGVSW